MRTIKPSIILLLILLTSCSSSRPVTTDSDPTTTTEYLVSPTITITESTSTAESITQPAATNSIVDRDAGISFREYNSMLGHGPTMPSKRMDVSPDGRLLAAVGGVETYRGNIMGSVFIWDFEDLDIPIQSYHVPNIRLDSLAFSTNGNWIAVGGCDLIDICVTQQVIVFDWETGVILGSVQLERNIIVQVGFANNDTDLLIQDENDQISVWNLSSGQVSTITDALASGANSFSVDPVGRFLAIGTHDGINVLNAAGYSQLEVHPEPRSGIGFGPAVVYSHDGQRLAASGCAEYNFEACIGGEIYLWSVERGVLESVTQAHNDRVFALDFTRDSSILASGSTDGLSIWNITTGQMIGSQYPVQTTHIYNIHFYSNDNKFVVFTDKGLVLGEIDAGLSQWRYTSLMQLGVGRSYTITLEGNGQNLYSEPSWASSTIRLLNYREEITIIEGPEFQDENIWWWVETRNGEVGWIVENPNWLQPIP